MLGIIVAILISGKPTYAKIILQVAPILLHIFMVFYLAIEQEGRDVCSNFILRTVMQSIVALLGNGASINLLHINGSKRTPTQRAR
jgi:hypothetical protein